MRARAIGFASIQLLLFSLSLVVLWAPSVRALSSVSDAPESGSFVRTLCEGDCTGLGVVPEGAGGLSSQIDFDFRLGLQAVGDGLSIDLTTDGNLYVVGAIGATGDVHLTAHGDLYLGDLYPGDFYQGDRGVDLGSIIIPDRDWPTEIDAGGLVVVGGPVGPTNPLDLGPGGTIIRALPPQLTPTPLTPLTPLASTLGLVSAATANGSDAALFDYTFNVSGDVYLDVSQVVLSSLRLKTQKVLVVVGNPLTPPIVPEPGSGLLLALGLLGLGFRRAHLSR